jgi:hypothetical protein
VRSADIPLLNAIGAGKFAVGEPQCGTGEALLYSVGGYVVPFFMITSATVSHSLELFARLLAAMPLVDGEAEPRMNVISYSSVEGGNVTIVMPRAKHRPDCYYAEGAAGRLVSPGALDMAGLVVTPRECDFETITADEAAAMLREVAMPQGGVDAVLAKLKKCDEKN